MPLMSHNYDKIYELRDSLQILFFVKVMCYHFGRAELSRFGGGMKDFPS